MRNSLILLLSLFLFAGYARADRFGAIAYDLNSNAYGVTWDQGTQAAADAAASAQCATISSNCGVVVRFANSCGAYATGPNLIWGMGTGNSRTVAERAAKFYCDQHAAAAGPFCRVRVWGCNSQASNGPSYSASMERTIDKDANRRTAEEQRHWGGQEQYDRYCRESGGCG